MNNKEVKVIVGANYGDEGKGLATHYFSQKATREGNSCLNILYNGGCQRGHTVEIDGSIRHVFHHFGSGTFDNADTYFDKDFMVNPMEFIREYKDLEQKGVVPNCYISPLCRVTTPFDMLINRIVEENRADNKHGSCGMGIWETTQRYLLDTYNYRWGDLIELPLKSVYIYLEYLKNVYVPKRLAEYGINKIPLEYQKIFEGNGLIEHFISDLFEMKSKSTTINYDIYNPDSFHKTYDTVIFEGAQGLALDEDNVNSYPNVTASKTGSYIPVSRHKYSAYSNTKIEVCYITRSYFTRHGVGRFPTECNVDEINPNIKDLTNVNNDFQGSIRYGFFDIEEISERINKDIEHNKSINNDVAYSLFITHLNYTNGYIHGLGNPDDICSIFSKSYLSYDRYGERVEIKRNDITK